MLRSVDSRTRGVFAFAQERTDEEDQQYQDQYVEED